MMYKPIDKHIFRLIADSTISVCDKTNFGTPLKLSEYIHKEIMSKNIKTISGYLYPIVENVRHMYGMETKEAATYVGEYFKDKKWLTYHHPVNDIRRVFGKFLSE